MIELMKSDLGKMTFKNDYPFSEDVLNNLEVLLSPLNTEDDNTKVAELVESHTTISSGELNKSNIKIRY